MKIEEVIKEKRKEKGLTQEELAQQLFISRQLISKWENKKSYPDLQQLIKLSDIFNISLDELMRGDQKMTKKLTMSLKNKRLFQLTIGILAIITLFFAYSNWSQQIVELTAKDLEIVSILEIPTAEIEVLNEYTGEKELVPQDASYLIEYKVKKPLTTILTGEYFGYLETDPNNLYVDVRGRKSLFNTKKVQEILVPVTNINDLASLDYSSTPPNNRGKNIRILKPSKINVEKPVEDQSWLWIDKKELE
uniref:helix-turn-helix domain-containing protein n=1 Tax=Carnobacterium alterfunditum TaxID=28230 RepID=UPI0034508205